MQINVTPHNEDPILQHLTMPQSLLHNCHFLNSTLLVIFQTPRSPIIPLSPGHSIPSKRRFKIMSVNIMCQNIFNLTGN